MSFVKLRSFSFEACCETKPLVKEESMQNLRLRYYIEAETYTGVKKFSRIWFDTANGSRPHYINRTVTLDATSLRYCQKEIIYLKVNFRKSFLYIFYVNSSILSLLYTPLVAKRRKIQIYSEVILH